MLFLPVSIGEAIDKLTILHIKLERINDKRRDDIKKEYDILYEKLKDFLIKYESLYLSMKKINIIIWDQMDILRDGTTSDEVYMKLCKECIQSNDIRFRIKNKINLISNSELKEQKSYKVNRLVIHINCEHECIGLLIGPIKHFSYIFDEIIIQSHGKLDELKSIFDYDNTIKYNMNLDNIDVKQSFVFDKKSYTKEEIYRIMNISDELLQSL